MITQVYAPSTGAEEKEADQLHGQVPSEIDRASKQDGLGDCKAKVGNAKS